MLLSRCPQLFKTLGLANMEQKRRRMTSRVKSFRRRRSRFLLTLEMSDLATRKRGKILCLDLDSTSISTNPKILLSANPS
jgi:hypothetical protein